MVVFKLFVQSQGIKVYQFILISEINAIIYRANQDDSFLFAYFNSEGEFTQTYQLQNFDPQLVQGYYVLHEKKVYFLQILEVVGQIMDLNQLQVNQVYQLEQFAQKDKLNLAYVFVQENIFYIYQSSYTFIQYTSWDNLILQVKEKQFDESDVFFYRTKNCVACKSHLFYKQQMHVFDSWAKFVLEIDYQQGTFLIQYFNASVRRSYITNVVGQKAIFSQDFKEYDLKIIKSIESNGVSLILVCSKSLIQFYNSKNLIELQTSEPIQKQIDEDCFIIENNLLLITSGKIVKFSYNVQKDQVDIFSKSQNFVNFKDYQMFSYKDLDKFSSKNGRLVILPSNKYSGYSYIWDSNLLFGICPNYCDYCQSDNVKICLRCQDNYLIQLNYKCDLTCPDSAILDQKESQCKCDDNSTLINNSCLCNQKFFQLKNQCITCSSNCKYCKDQTTCYACLQGYYLFPDQTCGFCDIQNGYFIQDNECIKCHQSCSSCSGTQQSQCTKCNKTMGFYQFSDLTCKKCDTNNGYFIDGGNCILCYKSCKTCFGAKNDQCQECYQNYEIDKNTCNQFQLSIESKEFPQSKVESIQKMSQSTSSALVISTSIMNSIQSIGSNSSFGILISSLTIQKLTYLYILNVLLPLQIGTALEILSGKLPSQQFVFLNVFYPHFDNSYFEYQNIKYKKVDLSFHILVNCGQAIILFAICSVLLLIFYILIEKTKTQKIKQISIKIYSCFFSSLLVQYFQLIIGMFIIGINLQIKEFYYNSNIKQLEIKIIISLILLMLSILIFQQMYKYLNSQNLELNQLSFQEITKEKILNETIFESKIRRNFIMIYLFCEAILIPTCFMQLSDNWKVVNIVLIIIYLAILVYIIYFKPFFSNITNIYFIVNNLLWLSLQIQFMIINYFCDQVNFTEYSSHIDNISYTFLVNVLFVQLIQPIYMIMILSIQLYDLIRKRMLTKVLQQQTNITNVENINSLNLTNISQELVNQKNVSLRIVQVFKKNKRSESNYKDQQIKNTQ